MFDRATYFQCNLYMSGSSFGNKTLYMVDLVADVKFPKYLHLLGDP